MKNIFISCGHNNARNLGKNENGKWVLGMSKDQWAVNPLDKTQTEYRWVKKVAGSLWKLIMELAPKEYNVVLVPEGLNLSDRITWINTRATAKDVCIELHMNSGGGTWVEVFAHAGSVMAMEKAKAMSIALSWAMSMRNRWAKPDTATRFGQLWFIRDTYPLAFLIELGFIDNASDRDAVWLKGAPALKLILWTL